MKERRSCQKLSLKSSMDPSQSVKCKIVVVGDSQCGKTALLHVFAKDCFPEVRPPLRIQTDERDATWPGVLLIQCNDNQTNRPFIEIDVTDSLILL